MAKTKAGVRKAERRSNRKEESDTSDIEVIDEIKSPAKTSKRGKKSAKAAAPKKTPSRTSTRDSQPKNYRDDEEDIESDIDDREDEPVKKKPAKKEAKKEEKSPKKKAPPPKKVPLTFSKSETRDEEEEEDDEVTTEDDKPQEDGEEVSEDEVPRKDKKGDVSEDDEKPAKKSAKPKAAAPKEKGAKKGRGRPKAKSPAPKKAKRDEPETDSESDTEYEVERIVEVKKHKDGTREFLVKWKGFSSARNTWEPEENLSHAKDLVENFLVKVDKSDVSRTRRLSTIQSTKSSRSQSVTRSSSSSAASSSQLGRTREGRVSKSRSRTPRITSSSGSRAQPLKSVQEDEESSSSSSSSGGGPVIPKLRENGLNLPLQKFMRESAERKLEMIKAQHRPSKPGILEEVEEAEESKKSAGKGSPSGEKVARNNPLKNIRLRRLTSTAAACFTAISLGAALVFTPSESLNWENISPHLQQAIQSVQDGWANVRANAPF